jgi:hypothetical protein
MPSWTYAFRLLCLAVPVLGLTSGPGSTCLAAPKDAVKVSRTGSVVTIANNRLAVAYDLSRGAYSAVDRKDGTRGISGAYFQVDEWASNRPGYRHTWESKLVRDRLGNGMALVITGACPGKPTLIEEIILYEGGGFFVLAPGIRNTTVQAIRVREMRPLTGAEAFAGISGKRDIKTLDGFAGAGETRVMDGPFRKSANNLLLTFTASGRRRSLVMGGLTYTDFLKYARTTRETGTETARRGELNARVKGTGRLAAYLDCGIRTEDCGEGKLALRQVTGNPFTWTQAESAAPSRYGSVAFDERSVQFEATGLDPNRVYVLGFSWWDYDANGRVESVYAEGTDGVRRPLLEKSALPDYVKNRMMPEERACRIPPEAYASGRIKIVFSNEAAVPNAVVGEVWLWEGGSRLRVPAEMASGRAAAPSSGPKAKGGRIPADLYAADPVGRLVDAGRSYLPNDRFYVDFTTADPFEALERYGLRLRAAQKAAPNLYDFPTVCAWYVGLFGYPADNRPERSKYRIATTPGLVEEMDRIGKTGFLKYARAAVRLVPDTYAPDNEQGWWDDAHWRKFLHYMEPYETTRKYGAAIRARGGLPFTYFQLVNESRDFRQAHPEMLLAGDSSRGLDYTNPVARAHMRRVYASMRAGGIAGMMFDYPNDMWVSQTVRGGFQDRHATAASAYRTAFALAKEGLGPNSWIHERVLGPPLSDITLGVVDSQRVWGDTSAIEPEMVSRCGLRWYKNRVVCSYDMDAKNLLDGWKRPGFDVSDRDGRRMLLTMAYVAASRLLLATSFRDMPPDTLYDLERTFPYHTRPRSARPVDAFISRQWPKVYDFTVNARWHQVTFFNNEEPARTRELSVALSGEPVSGALGLDPAGEYYVYDFWNDRFVGRFRGRERLRQVLRPGEARMLSIHRVENHPQFLSTNRHVMQGYVDMVGTPKWDERRLRLTGRSKVIGGETYKFVLVGNGYRPVGCAVSEGTGRLERLPRRSGLWVLNLDVPKNAVVAWSVRVEGRAPRAR